MKIIDIHTHGMAGLDTTTTSAEDILKIAAIHGSHGVSEIIPTVYSAPLHIMRDNMRAIRQAGELQKAEGREPRGEAKIIGIHLEGPFLNPTRCGALDANSFLEANENNLKTLLEGYENILKIITISPELQGATGLIRKISEMGIIASMGHSDATYSEAEAGFHAGARGITHIFNAMRGIHHREPGIAGFGLISKDVYIEVIADPFHLDPKMIELIVTIKNPDRIMIVSDSVKDTESEPGSRRIINNEHKLLGGTMPLKESAERLIRMGLNKNTVMKAISENPERYLQANT